MMLWIWFGIALASVLLELLTPTALICIWFALGAVVALIMSWLKVAIWIQFIVFFSISLLCFILTRPLSKKLMQGNIVATNADRVIHKEAIVLSDISEHQWGIVKVLGTQWHAISSDQQLIEKGSIVRVIAIDGAKLIVKKI